MSAAVLVISVGTSWFYRTDFSDDDEVQKLDFICRKLTEHLFLQSYFERGECRVIGVRWWVLGMESSLNNIMILTLPRRPQLVCLSNMAESRRYFGAPSL